MSDTTTSDTTVKPGWRTTEFWLSSAAKLLGILFASGVIGDGTVEMRIAGLAAMLLAALGYTVSRAVVKAAGIAVLVIAVGSTQPACATARPRVAAGLSALIDCTTPQRAAVVDDIGHALLGYVLKYVTGDGRSVDTAKLKADSAALKGEALASCGLVAALAILATPKPPAPPSFYAEPPSPDPAVWRAALEQVRAELGVGPVKGG